MSQAISGLKANKSNPIQQSEEIMGIQIKGQEHTISLFTDDVIIYLRRTSTSFLTFWCKIM